MSIASFAKKSETTASRAASSLRIGPADCASERQADRVAQQVMSGSRARFEQASSAADGNYAPQIVEQVLRSPGRPLDAEDRRFFESRFRYDFSNVRVHGDALAADSAREVNALAYAAGNAIVLGRNVSPDRATKTRLLAHELTHVVQQSKNHTRTVARQSLHPEPQPHLASVSGGATREVEQPQDGAFYNGVNIIVRRGGEKVFQTRAVSGNPGSTEAAVNIGPIPDGKYQISPQITRPPVSALQSGICGAAGIPSGYQELTSTDQSPDGCEHHNHYCTVSCPTSADPTRVCFTPVGCWGSKRIRIEGSATVTTPAGTRAVRDGFYIHGGDHSVDVTSGCIKAFDNSLFDELRKFKKSVPLWVTKAAKPVPTPASGP